VYIENQLVKECNFENRSTFAKVIIKCQGAYFFVRHSVLTEHIAMQNMQKQLTAPLAPCTNTLSPAVNRAFITSALYAVKYGIPMAAPCWNFRAS